MRAPWRERLMTALLVVAVAVPVGIVIGGGLDFGGPDDEVLDVAEAAVDGEADTTTTAGRPTTTTTAAPTTTTAAGRPAGEVRVRFYNGSRTAGAAVTVGQRLEALGYDVLPPGRSPPEPIEATVVAHRDGFETEAATVARDLGVGSSPTPYPPVPAVAGVGEADVVVIVADDAVAPDAEATSPPPG